MIPWDEPEDDYASQFHRGFGAPSKPFQMALSALIIKVRLQLEDEEPAEQIKANRHLQPFIDLKGFENSTPLDPLMMVYFSKRLPETVINDCNERIGRYGISVIQSETAADRPGGSADFQLRLPVA